MSRLLLVRHGETEFNSAGRFHGQTDAELNATGVRQAERLRRRLSQERIDAVYSSDMRRALMTAEVISSRRRLDIVACPELREINFGKVEGLTFAEIGVLYPELAELIAGFSPRLRFPEGEGIGEFIERTVEFLDRLNKHAPEATVLIVAHSTPLRLLVCRMLGLDQSHWWQLRFDLASLSILEIHQHGAILSLLNDVSHLRGV